MGLSRHTPKKVQDGLESFMRIGLYRIYQSES